MKIYQSKSFEKTAKKLHKQEKDIIDQEIKNIAGEMRIGEEKRGDLKGIFIHKFKIKTTEYLLAYQVVGEDLELVMIGPQENYYRDLKKYKRSK